MQPVKVTLADVPWSSALVKSRHETLSDHFHDVMLAVVVFV